MARQAVEPVRALTALRGLAAWWVVLFHFREALPAGTPRIILQLAEPGYLAVDLFFLLSGYVIALNYGRSVADVGPARILHFLLLRLARIYPLHLFMLALYLANPIAILAFSAQGSPGERYDPGYFLLSLLLVQNWGFAAGLAWNVPAWSISTEWFAYLIFPLTAACLLRTVVEARIALLTLAAMLMLLSGVSHAIGQPGLGFDIPSFGLLRCCVEFFCGTLLWRLQSLRPRMRHAEGNLATAASLGCFVALASLPLADYDIAPLGFALLIWGLLDHDAVLSRLLANPVLEQVGLVSYSTYLCHFFVKDWVGFLLVRPGVPDIVPVPAYLAIVAVMSVLLYRTVELPGRRAGRALAERWIGGAAARRQSW